MDNFITVVTPTYNRLSEIKNLYFSLKNQTCYKFEWLVIDDGSNDGTDAYFSSLHEKSFRIIYYKTTNGGKHRALNRAVQCAKGDFVFIVDSDDTLIEDAIETVYSWVKVLPQDFAGVSGLRGYTKTTPMGNVDCFSGVPYLDRTYIQRRDMKSMWDMAEVYRTSILKKYPFPEFEGERFITESVVWNRIANDGYLVRWYGKIIYLSGYHDGGLTLLGRKKFIDNKKGYALSVWQELNYYKHTFKEKIVIYYEFYNDLKSSLSVREMASLLKVNYMYLKLVILIMDYRHPNNSEK